MVTIISGLILLITKIYSSFYKMLVMVTGIIYNSEN